MMLQSDSLSVPDTATGSVAVHIDTLEQLVDQVEDVEESSVADLIEEIFGAKENPTVSARSRFTRKLQPARAYLDGRYSGPSSRIYQRYKLAGGDHLAAGILLEKDPGESRVNDFTSGYLLVKKVGPIRTFVLGDYIVEAGQGVALWRGYDFPKGAEVVVPVRRESRGLMPYASSDEYSFLRGAAIEIEWADRTLTAFYSHRRLSATVDTSGNVSGIYTAGYFRTPTEKEKRNNLAETLGGLRGLYRLSDRDQIGVTGYATFYSREFAAPHLYGKRFTIVSADYQLVIRSIDIFGEWSVNNASVGGITGVHTQVEKSFEIITAFRSYPSSFLSIHNNGFGERYGTANERGWYLAARVRPLRGVRMAVYFDLFSFPEKTSTSLFGGNGHEMFFQADVTALPRLSVTPRFRRKVTVERTSIVDALSRTVRFDDEKRKENYRITADYRLNRTTSLRSRFEFTQIDFRYLRRKEHGMLMYCDVVVKPSGRFSFNGRLAVFRTDSFDSGIGEYERDLPGVLSVPILYGRGVKWYVLLHYSLMESLRLSFKYSELIRDDVKTIGSGLDEILTNRDNRIGVQLDFSL